MGRNGIQGQTFVPVHTPPVHSSRIVQRLPSSHGVPSGLGGFEQSPVAGLQAPASWHGSEAVQVTGFEPTQLPAWQVSVCVQALSSLQAEPFDLAGFEHWPVDGLQVPALWH